VGVWALAASVLGSKKQPDWSREGASRANVVIKEKIVMLLGGAEEILSGDRTSFTVSGVQDDTFAGVLIGLIKCSTGYWMASVSCVEKMAPS
jgi:hypothetical protein